MVRRYKANGEKRPPAMNKVAEVVRDPSRRNIDRGLSAGRSCMLAQARAILGSKWRLRDICGR